MKLLLTLCVMILHHSLISCRTVSHSELDSPNEDMDSPTEEIANLLIPLIEKTLEKNSNQRARKLIKMLPYNDSIEASRWPTFNKKRVVEIMPLRRKQRRGDKPLAYLLAAPHSEIERKESRRGVRKHETEDIDIKHKEHELEPNDDSVDHSVEIKHDDNQRRGHAYMISRNHETEESEEHSGGSSESVSRSESEELDSRVDKVLDYDEDDHDAASQEDDNNDDESNETDEKISKEENTSEKNEFNDHVSENIEEVNNVQPREDDITEDSRESVDENESEEENVSVNLKKEIHLHHGHNSDESDQIDDSDDSLDWGTKDVSFEDILDKIDEAHSNGDNIFNSFVHDSKRSSNCSRLNRERDINVNEGDRRHEHKSYRLSFLFNR